MKRHHFLLFCLLLSIPTPLHAYWLKPSRAEKASSQIEFHIKETEILCKLWLAPSESSFFPKSTSTPPSSSNQEFDLIIETDEHYFLHGSITRRISTPSKIPPLAVAASPPATPSSPPFLHYIEITYPLSSDSRPKSLTIHPPSFDSSSTRPPSLGLLTFDRKIPLSEVLFFTQAETINLHPSDPWASFRKKNPSSRGLKNPVITFLAPEKHEVKIQFLIRLKELFTLYPELENHYHDQQFKKLTKESQNLLSSQFTLQIDQKNTLLLPDSAQLACLTRNGVSFRLPDDLTSPASTFLALSYYTPYPDPQSFPTSVNLTLDNKLITSLGEILGITSDGMTRSAYELTDVQRSLFWSPSSAFQIANPLATPISIPASMEQPSLPLLAIILTCGTIALLISFIFHRSKFIPPRLIAGGSLFILSILAFYFRWGSTTLPIHSSPAILPAQASPIVKQLLSNIYRSFEYRNESAIYDTLELSLHGDILKETYLKMNKALQDQNSGAARARVRHIEILHISRATSPPHNDQTFTCTWLATGSVSHWGHTHTRRNQYRAHISISPVDNDWKITHLDILEQSRR